MLLQLLFPTVGPPRVDAHPIDVLTNNGSNVTFSCEAFSYVSTNFTWLRNGDVIDEIPTIIITTNNNAHVYITTLTILSVQLPDDGNYVCRAVNREGEVLSNAATLTVFGKSNFSNPAL